MSTRAVKTTEPQQTPEQIVAVIEGFLAEHPTACVLEDGKVLFDLSEAKYTLSTEHNRCTLQLWGAGGNMVRRVGAAEQRGTLKDRLLKLSTYRFGQAQPKMLELAGDRDRRTPTTREATRMRYVKTLERVLERGFPEWRPEAFRTAMDLEKSFGPAYARGLLVQGSGAAGKAWAVIGVNDEETPATIDGILTFGILWLEAARELGGGRRLVQGLKVIVPVGMAALTLSRMAWLNGASERWELWELDQRDREETLTRREAADQGNLTTRLIHAPNEAAARERFADAARRVMGLVPEAFRGTVAQRLRSGTELAFTLHGLEFARVRVGAAADSFNRVEQISFGSGAAETELTAANEDALRALVEALCERRRPGGSVRDALYRMQPERWLEEELRRDPLTIDRTLDPAHLHAQVAAVAAGDRGMLDLLGVAADGRLTVIEVKADEDPQMALQGLDYWVRVRWHHAQHPDAGSGLGEFQRHGYFAGVRLAADAPRLLLVAPALRIHPATEVVLRHVSSRVDWTLIAVGERWREKVKVAWRKRAGDQGVGLMPLAGTERT